MLGFLIWSCMYEQLGLVFNEKQQTRCLRLWTVRVWASESADPLLSCKPLAMLSKLLWTKDGLCKEIQSVTVLKMIYCCNKRIGTTLTSLLSLDTSCVPDQPPLLLWRTFSRCRSKMEGSIWAWDACWSGTSAAGPVEAPTQTTSTHLPGLENWILMVPFRTIGLRYVGGKMGCSAAEKCRSSQTRRIDRIIGGKYWLLP